MHKCCNFSHYHFSFKNSQDYLSCWSEETTKDPTVEDGDTLNSTLLPLYCTEQTTYPPKGATIPYNYFNFKFDQDQMDLGEDCYYHQ